MSDGTCTVAGCEKPIKRQTLCYGHYMKQWRYGTPTPTHAQRWADLTGQRFGMLVAVERNADGKRWLCKCDCGGESAPTVGSLNAGTTTTCGDRAVHRRTDDITYATAHDRVRSDRGEPRDHACVDCGSTAQDWSYNHTDPDERHGWIKVRQRWSYLVPYSIHPEHYSPRCVPCHRSFDKQRAA